MADLERQPVPLGRRPGLLLVDLSRGFTDPASPLGSEADAVVAANAQLLAAFRELSLPVIYTTVAYFSNDQAPVFRSRLPALNCLTPDSPWVEIDPRLAPANGELVITKQFASAFFDTDLKRELVRAGVDSLVITGLTTSGCVRASVVDALQHDFPVWVPREAVGDRNPEAHEANLHDMHAKYADVVSVAETLASIEALAG